MYNREHNIRMCPIPVPLPYFILHINIDVHLISPNSNTMPSIAMPKFLVGFSFCEEANTFTQILQIVLIVYCR